MDAAYSLPGSLQGSPADGHRSWQGDGRQQDAGF